MNTLPDFRSADGTSAPMPQSTRAAKDRLLIWAEEHDFRKAQARASMGSIVTGGAIAALGGAAIARMLLPPRRQGVRLSSWTANAGGRGDRWALAASAGTWLVQYAIGQLRKRMTPRAVD